MIKLTVLYGHPKDSDTPQRTSPSPQRCPQWPASKLWRRDGPYRRSRELMDRCARELGRA